MRRSSLLRIPCHFLREYFTLRDFDEINGRTCTATAIHITFSRLVVDFLVCDSCHFNSCKSISHVRVRVVNDATRPPLFTTCSSQKS